MLRFNKIIWPVLISIAFLAAINSFAQQRQSEIKPDQYRAVHLTMEDGLSFDGQNVMIKDIKGFLWSGSRNGELCRFDGAAFKKYIPDTNKPGTINSGKILALTEDSLHNIWIGTEKGLSKYDLKADTFTNFVTPIDRANSESWVMPFWSANNQVYCVESGLRIVAYNINSFKRKFLLSLSDKPINDFRWSNNILLDTTSNSLWMLGQDLNHPGNGVLLQISLNSGKRKQYAWPCYRNIQHRHSAEALRLDRKRNLIWLNTGDGLIEFSLRDKQFHHIDALNEFVKLKDYDSYVGIDMDKDGRIWLATKPKGILIYDPETEQVKQLFSDPDLQQKIAEHNLYIYCDRDGITWTTYYIIKGIYELLPYDPPIIRYTANSKIKDSLSNSTIYSIIPRAQDQMWLSTADGLNIFDPVKNKFQVLRERDLPGFKGNTIILLYVDTINQKAWLGAPESRDNISDMDLYEMDIKTRICRPVIFRGGSKQLDRFSISPSTIQPYKNGFLLCDESHGLFEVKANSMFAELLIPFKSGVGRVELVEDRLIFVGAGGGPNLSFENRNGKWVRSAHFLDSLDWRSMFYNKKDQTLWVSFKYELVHYDKDFHKIKTYNQEDGYNGEIYSMQMDDSGNLWFINVLNKVGRLNIITGIITTLSETDGYQKLKFDWFDPGAKDARGNLYFGTSHPGKENGGLIVIYPERYLSATTSSVYLRSLIVNQRPFRLSTGVNNLEKLSLRYNQNTISIETGIIDYYTKGKSNLRYKLIREGKDEEWQYGTDYSTIRYDGLVPGNYKLVMQSSNAGNEFNGPEKILMINISPPFWETWWFRTLAVVFLLAMFYAIYRWRTASLRKQKRILEQTVIERTAEVVKVKVEVEKQKAKSDELLLNILPSEVAEELKEKGYTTAKSFDEVTVLFSDIKGFTHVAEKMTAQELVKEIDTYFSAFDRIMQKYGLEKIKTIGDAYIAAGGLPEKNAATAQNVVESAIAMQQAVEILKQERISSGNPFFELRIGIHTGPVVAGVVGIKKFQYDIWGDTVNLAARMEQSGVPGKINISQYTYEKIKDQFNCVHRGKIEAKNKGEVDMYFVEQPK